MAKTKTKGTAKTVSDTPVPQPITIRSTNPKIMADNILKLEESIKAADVSANPTGTAEETLLTSIGIDGKKYNIGASAEDVSYDNTDSGLTATNVQAAINEVVSNVSDLTDYIVQDGEVDFTLASGSTFNSNPTTNIVITEGYTPIGIIGFQTNNAQVVPINVSWVNSSWGIGLRNLSTGEQSGTLVVKILCIKTRS